MAHTEFKIHHEWEQLKNCYQRLEWMAESRGLSVDELLESGYPWKKEAHPLSFREQEVMARLRALVFKAYSK
ncbi:MAG: hypothetical protein ACKOQ6_01345 [Bacteroidota bacterium]